MLYLVLIAIIAVTVTLLIWSRLREHDRLGYVLKPLATILVIVVALLSLTQATARPAFTLWIVVGLVLSLGGDVTIMVRTNRWFLVALVLFLLAHVVYAAVLTVYNGFHPQDLVTAALLLAVAVPFYFLLRPNLGSMKVPVIVYMLVITFMVNRAFSTFFGEAFTTKQAWMLSVGALLFWLSDLVLAINRFHKQFKRNHFSLYLYYGGQMLIALAPSFFGGE